MSREYTHEDVESVFQFFHGTGVAKEELFQLMNELTPWVSGSELEKLWKQRRKVVVQ